jgi:hypothetical protein
MGPLQTIAIIGDRGVACVTFGSVCPVERGVGQSVPARVHVITLVSYLGR